MKKLYTLASAFLIVGATLAQSFQADANKGPATKRLHHTFSPVSSNSVSQGTGSRAEGDVIGGYSYDFTDNTGWTTGLEGITTDAWVYDAVAAGPQGGFSIGPMTSTSGGANYLFDSDALCGGDQHAWLMSPVIDLTGFTYVNLNFEQRYALYTDQVFVDVTTDGGGAWTPFQVNVGAAANAAVEDLQSIDISTAITGNPANVQVRFRFASGADAGNGGDGCDYAWMIDDVAFVEGSVAALIDPMLSDLTYDGPVGGSIPLEQGVFSNFAVSVTNNGSTDIVGENVALNVEAGLFTDNYTTGTIVQDAIENAAFTNTFQATQAGYYQSGVSISVTGDEDLTNNYDSSFAVNIVDSVYSMDAGFNLQNAYGPTFAAYETPFWAAGGQIMAQIFTLINADTLTSLSGDHNFPVTAVDTVFEYSVYSVDVTGQPDQLIATTASYTVTPADTTAAMAETTYTLMFDTGIELPAGDYAIVYDEPLFVTVTGDNGSALTAAWYTYEEGYTLNYWAGTSSFDPISSWGQEVSWSLRANFGRSCNLTTTVASGNATTAGGSEGYAQVTAIDGQGAISYAWSHDAGAAGSTVTGLEAGVYSVTVVDNITNGCMMVETLVITEPGALTCTIGATAGGADASVSGAADGRAFATPTGNQGGITYLWSNGATIQSLTGLIAGVYDVTVTDDAVALCSATASFTVSEPAPLVCMLSVTADGGPAITAGGTEGYAFANVSGDQGVLTYAWSNAEITASITGLAANTYMVTVTDDAVAGCTATDSYTVVENLTVTCAIGASASSTDATINGAADGTAMVSAFGGIGNVTYLWSNSEITASISGLIAGVYTVTVTDDASSPCAATATVTISEPAPLTCDLSAVISSQNATTIGGQDGEASVTVFDGQGTIAYLWSDGQLSATATGLAAGAIMVTITDDVIGGCEFITSITVGEDQVAGCNLTASITSTSVTANGGSDGSATVSLLGNQGAITYVWSHDVAETGSSVAGLIANSYSVTVTDAIVSGCSSVQAVTIIEPAAATCDIALVMSKTNASANGLSDGSVTASVTGGQGTISYVWSNGAGDVSMISNVAAGVYFVTVSDAILTGCTAVGNATVTEPAAITCDIDVTASIVSVGTATAVATGVQGNVTYVWSNGATGATATGLTAGSYTVVAADDVLELCLATATVVVTGIEEVNSIANYSIFPNPNNGTFTLNFVNADNDNYRISVRNVIGQVVTDRTVQIAGNNKEVINLNNADAGVYFVTVKGANGERTERVIVK